MCYVIEMGDEIRNCRVAARRVWSLRLFFLAFSELAQVLNIDKSIATGTMRFLYVPVSAQLRSTKGEGVVCITYGRRGQHDAPPL